MYVLLLLVVFWSVFIQDEERCKIVSFYIPAFIFQPSETVRHL